METKIFEIYLLKEKGIIFEPPKIFWPRNYFYSLVQFINLVSLFLNLSFYKKKKMKWNIWNYRWFQWLWWEPACPGMSPCRLSSTGANCCRPWAAPLGGATHPRWSSAASGIPWRRPHSDTARFAPRSQKWRRGCRTGKCSWGCRRAPTALQASPSPRTAHPATPGTRPSPANHICVHTENNTHKMNGFDIYKICVLFF